MIRSARKIYCDNEHGCGDVVFPENGEYVDGPSIRELRRQAKAAGWLRTRRNDFCPECGYDQLDLSEEQRDKRRLALEAKFR